MHEYSVSGHDRKLTYYILAMLSSLAGIGIGYLLSEINKTFGIVIAAPSGFAVFAGLFALFDKWVWNCVFLYQWGLIKIPNLNGKWSAVITTANKELIGATVTIHQTYSKVRICLETNNSDSLSQMAIIEMNNPSRFTLRYEYTAEYKRDLNLNIQRHYGVASVVLKSDDHQFRGAHSANYYTEQGRDTHGEINLHRNIVE